MTPTSKHKSAVIIYCFIAPVLLYVFSAARSGTFHFISTARFEPAGIKSHPGAIKTKPGIPLNKKNLPATPCNTINWATWSQFRGFTSVGTIVSAGKQIDVLMTANYSFDSTPQIYGYSKYSNYPIPVPNTTVPRTTWAAGAGGSTSMCFSEQVSNPVLLLSSLGSVNTASKLTFSLPYVVLYDGGGMVYNDNKTITGNEGYAIIMFPGDFTCVTINSETPEFYTNITWGLMPPTFPIEMTGDTTGCDQVTLTAGGGQTYKWDGGDTPNQATNTFHTSGSYILTVTRADGCMAYLAEHITVNTTVGTSASITASTNQPICAGTPVTFTATPVNGGKSPTYQWQVNGVNAGGDTSAYTSATLADGDTVRCLVTGNASCAVPLNDTSNTIAVRVNPVPQVNAGGNKNIKKGGSTTLTATATNIGAISWSPAAGLDNPGTLQPVASPAVTTKYFLTVTSKDGCVGKDSLIVTVSPALTVPNTITPNGDGVNDTWEITNIGNYQGVTVDIFDRYGQSVFHSEGYHKPWDGTYNGKPVPAGTYYYLINLNDRISPVESGWVAVIR